MEVLGVGPLELFFILIIALIFLGPRDMVKTGRMLGRFMRRIVMSPTWRMVQQTSREIRTLPNRLIREAGMEEDVKDLEQLRKDVGNQIGSLRRPFSAVAGEVNQDLQQAQSELKAQGGLGTWTTPPAMTQSAAESSSDERIKPETEGPIEGEPDSSDPTGATSLAIAQTPNPDET
jgi:Sec-independent protein translocase protein TatA